MNDTSGRWLDRYLAHLRDERRLAAHTLTSYRRDLEHLAAWCGRQGVSRWCDADALLLRRYAGAEHRRGMSARSIQRRLSAVRRFFDYLVRSGEVRSNPAADVTAPKARRHLPQTLDADAMSAMLTAEAADDPLLLRDRAMLELLYSCGLRLAELVGLDRGALDLDDRTVRVHGKGNRTRIVPVGRMAVAALQDWLRVRPQLAAVGEAAIFVSSRGRRLSGRAVQERVRLWARRRGVDQRVFPHLFRHSCASHVLESSGDLRAVQDLLGHANISTTQIYTHLDFQHLARVYDATHPRARRGRGG